MHAVASWIMTYTLHSVLICAIAIAVIRAIPSNAAQKCRVWRVALLGPFVTASLAFAVTAYSATSVTSLIAPYAPLSQEQNVDVQIRHISGAPEIRRETVIDPFARGVAAAIIGFVVIASGLGGFGFYRRRAVALRQLSARTKCLWELPAEVPEITLSTSERVRVPLALRGREICVPTSFGNLESDERRSILLHEAAHIARRDPDWLDVARIVSAVAWWQPLNRYVGRMLERDSELAADAQALSAGANGPALVRALAYFAALFDSQILAGASLVSDESPLVGRARAILAGDMSSRRNSVPLVIVAAICVALLAVPRLTTARSALGAGHGNHSVLVQDETTRILR
jgi:beta-lactamase regulating signal transducer with metallopeptidase domain